MVTLDILYCNSDIIAISIDGSRYFIRVKGLPQVYDASGQMLAISSIDAWLSANTHNRYTYQSFIDMNLAYLAGVRSCMSKDDIDDCIDDSIIDAIHSIMQKGYIQEYVLKYWIEVLDNDQLDRCIKRIRDNIDKLAKLNKDGLYNDLCRLLEVCEIRQLNHLSDICLCIMAKQGMTASRPVFPDTADLDGIVLKRTKNSIDLADNQGVLLNITKIADDLAKLNYFVVNK